MPTTNEETTESLTANKILATILAMPRTQPFEIVFDECAYEKRGFLESR